MNREKQYKIVLLGDQGVGKTSIANVFVKNEFNAYENATSGANYHSKSIKIDNHNFQFAIWDTAGQEKFRSLARLYYRDSSAAILVYDVTNAKSFSKVTDWINELNENSENAIKFIVGNKIDQVEKEEVSYDAAKQLAENFGCLMRLVSAKEKNGITELFNQIGTELIKREGAVETHTDNSVQIQQQQQQSRSTSLLPPKPLPQQNDTGCC